MISFEVHVTSFELMHTLNFFYQKKYENANPKMKVYPNATADSSDIFESEREKRTVRGNLADLYVKNLKGSVKWPFELHISVGTLSHGFVKRVEICAESSKGQESDIEFCILIGILR